MYPFSSKNGTCNIGTISPQDAFDVLLSFPKRYQNHRVEGTYWECRLIHQTSESITLQLIDKNFERPRGPVKHSDVPYFRLQLREEAEETVLHYTYRWQLWKLALAVFSICFLTAEFIYVAVIFPQLSSRDILFFIIHWTFLSILLVYWLVSNYRHDKLTLQVFKTLLEKRFPVK